MHYIELCLHANANTHMQTDHDPPVLGWGLIIIHVDDVCLSMGMGACPRLTLWHCLWWPWKRMHYGNMRVSSDETSWALHCCVNYRTTPSCEITGTIDSRFTLVYCTLVAHLHLLTLAHLHLFYYEFGQLRSLITPWGILMIYDLLTLIFECEIADTHKCISSRASAQENYRIQSNLP